MMKLDQLHYYDLYAPLVASVDLKYTPERGAEAACSRRSRRSAPTIRRRSAARSTSRWIDLYPNEGKRLRRLLERRRLRRPSVHADQLQRPVHRRQHAGPRARPHDAELLLEQDAAVSAGRLPDLRRGGRVDVQRVAAHRLHAQADQGRRHAAVAARQLSREHQGHGVPPDAVRRVRAADARDGAEGGADHRRGAGQAVSRHHEEVLRPRSEASASSTTTSRTSGATSRTSIATSTSSSTRPRSPRPRRWRRK